MISENDDKQRAADRAHLAWGFALSIPLTLLIWMLVSHNFGLENSLLKMAQESNELVTSTSIVHMDRRPIPEPKQNVAQPQAPVLPKPLEQPQPAIRRAQPTPQAQPTEIAREEPKAPPQSKAAKTQQKAASLSEMLAQQQAAFQRETQAINANRAPLTNATIDPNSRPRSEPDYHMDIAGMRTASGPGDGFLTALTHWTDHGYHCYYGRYDWQYPDGGTETANIPWPFCYTPREDPIIRGYRRFPFPLPLPGYRLPAGTDLQPVEKRVYNLWLSTQQP
jgi:hypothetical protein